MVALAGSMKIIRRNTKYHGEEEEEVEEDGWKMCLAVELTAFWQLFYGFCRLQLSPKRRNLVRFIDHKALATLSLAHK